MSHTSTIALVSALANGDADMITVEQYYGHLLDDLARYPWFVNASLVPLTAGTGEYTLEDSHVKLLGVFYDDVVLDLVNKRTLESLSSVWRDHVGRPTAYTVDDEDAKTYRLYPVPDRPSNNFIFMWGSPLGMDYPAYSVLLLHTEIRTELPDWMDLPVAFEVLAREYGHESNHRDDELSDFCAQFAQVLWSMIQ